MRLSIARILSCAAAFVTAVAPVRLIAEPPPAPIVLGTVKDTTGHPIHNVTVVITALRRSTTTDAEGRFFFRGLPPGRHHLDVFMIGFTRAETEVLVPADGGDVTVEIVLTPSIVRLSSVVVSASPTGGDPLGITQSTVDLSGKALARNLTSSVALTLSSEPGMAVRYNGPAANVPIIRGLTGDRILVLQDGERAGDLSSAAPDHGLTIDPLAAERVEVVRGPASLMYGSSALGGVVNVISNDIPTTLPTHVTGSLSGQAESVTPGGAASGNITIPLGKVAVLLGGGFRDAQNTWQGGRVRLLNSEARNNYQQIGFGVIGDAASGGLAFKRYDFRYGLPADISDPEFGAHIDGLRNDAKGQLDLVGGSGLFRSVHIGAAAQGYTHDEIEDSGDIGTSFDLKTQTLDATVKTAFWGQDGALGVSGLAKQYAATGEEALTPAANSAAMGGFLFQEFALGTAEHEHAPRLQVGARFDRYAIESKTGDPKFGEGRSRDFNAVSGSVGITIPTAERSSLAFNVARAFRAPTVEELFSNAFHAAAGTFDVGNPDLDAEINLGVESVYRMHTGRVDAQFSAYVNRISNFVIPDISGDTLTDEGDLVPLNHYAQSDATFRGVEADLETQVGQRFVVGVVGDVVRASLTGGGNVPFLPPARIGARLRWDNGHVNVGVEARHGFAQTRVSGGDIDVPTDAYNLVNLSAGWSIFGARSSQSVTLRIDNLLDEAYRDATSRIKSFALNPGRNIAVVYKIAL